MTFYFRLNVPPSQQANKALIMKATAEAEKSVNSTLQHVLKEEKLYSARGKDRIYYILCIGFF
jgi:hypothetical protein